MIDKFVQVDGLKIRCLEEGQGPEVLLLHGAALGSSADVWERNLDPLAGHGFRVIAFDQPGFGLSDCPRDYSVAYRRRFILQLMDSLEINKAHLVGHSQAGGMAVSLAFDHPQRISKVIVLGTGSLLPPLSEGRKQAGPREGQEGTASEPTLEDSRALLEHNLFNHSLITPDKLEKRHRMSVGKNFQAFLERNNAAQRGSSKANVPLWQRLDQVPVPLLLIYGKEDRGSAAKRAALAKERYPHLNLHLVDHCKHLVQWDAAAEFERLAVQFLAS
ncbi:MAG: alpha/beta hydrolase [Deltaproteobacteria bacterium]|nr:alpha/beta hydrolase [Deltaproteobacteria bacterium]